MPVNRKLTIGIGAAVLVAASLAFAGAKYQTVSVYIAPATSGVSYFYGTMGAVRASANPTEYIGCWLAVSNPPGPNSNQVNCGAQDASGRIVACTASGPSDWNPLAGATENSHFDVTFYPDVAQCSTIRVFNDSYHPVIQN
jgi:hypothetical protein